MVNGSGIFNSQRARHEPNSNRNPRNRQVSIVDCRLSIVGPTLSRSEIYLSHRNVAPFISVELLGNGLHRDWKLGLLDLTVSKQSRDNFCIGVMAAR